MDRFGVHPYDGVQQLGHSSQIFAAPCIKQIDKHTDVNVDKNGMEPPDGV
jgi:hypothetical protein